MAKAQKLDVFKKTEHTPTPEDPNADLDNGNIKATGIGLRQGEIEALTVIAGSLEVNRNAVMRAFMRWAIKEYRAGRLDLAALVEAPPPPKNKLNMP